MFEESRENTGGVIAGMLRSLEDGHLDIVPSAELKKAELAASPANNSSDEVLEMAGDFNYDGYQVVRREFFAHINEPSYSPFPQFPLLLPYSHSTHSVSSPTSHSCVPCLQPIQRKGKQPSPRPKPPIAGTIRTQNRPSAG